MKILLPYMRGPGDTVHVDENPKWEVRGIGWLVELLTEKA
jgi:hypothetical protein